MSEKNSIQIKTVMRLVGLGLILLALCSVLSVLSYVWGFSYYCLFYLFGIPGFWGISLMLILIGGYLLFKGELRSEWLKWNVYLGLILLLLGIGAILSLVSFSSPSFSTIGDYQDCFNSFASAAKSDPNGQAVKILIGSDGKSVAGGLLGYLLAALFNFAHTPGIIVFSIVFMLGGLALMFLDLIKFLASKSVSRPIKKKEPKPAKVRPEPVLDRPEIVIADDDDEELGSRYEMNNELPASRPVSVPLPKEQEIDTSSFVSAKMEMNGLVESVFDPYSNSTEKEKIKPAEMPMPEVHKEERLESNEIAIPHSEPAVSEPIISPVQVEAPATPEETIKEESEEEYVEPVKPAPVFVEPKKAPAPVVDEPKPAPVVEEPKPEPAPVVDPNAWYYEHGVKPKQERKPYTLPPRSLLAKYPPNDAAEELKLDAQQKAALINKCFDDMHVGASVVDYVIGPSITRFLVQTDSSVSVKAIASKITDISVRLNGVSVRHVEIVKGTPYSGLEIKNKKTSMVSFEELLEHLPQEPEKHLYIPFGKGISGEYISASVASFPHMLVCGTTGSGKSIFMHSLILSLIMRNRPEDLKFAFIDPKRVELTKYSEMPHLLCPVISDMKQAKVCVDKIIAEMENRLQIFEHSRVSNLEQFNGEICPKLGLEPLPYIVLVIDEFADLVDTCKNIGASIVRIAQKSRAAGIHMVIATQRPTADVIDGRIKSNLPTRVALRVKTQLDSSIILGTGGAESLAGYGDMLVDCEKIDPTALFRCQGCMVQNSEINDVHDFVIQQQSAVYDPNFLDLRDPEEIEAEEMQAAAANAGPSRAEIRNQESMDLYEQIREDVMASEYTSISRIQRTYGIGFPRAGRIMSKLQKEGIVSMSGDSSKGSRVLVHSLEELAAGNEGEGEEEN